jgi:mannose-1-phosphate guanylyltransferase
MVMKAIVLAGGYATRLRPISYALPKLLFPVLGKAMVYWTLDLLRRSGVDYVVLCVNYLADLLRAEVGSSYKGMGIAYSLENVALGTGGPLKLASTITRLDETFFAMNGDVIADVDLTNMLNRHKQTSASVTVALREVKDPSRFGVAQLDDTGRATRYVEKPKTRDAPSRLANAGVYAIEPEVMQMIPDNRKVSLEREIFPLLVRDGKLFGFPFSGHWFDIGKLSEFQKANFTLLQERARRPSLEENASVAANATIKAPVFLSEATKVESKAAVGPRVIAGKDVLIESGARVSNSILFDGVTIGEGSVVSGAIVASNVKIGRKVRIEAGTVVSPHVKIDDGVKVGRDALIHPYKEIDSNIKPGTHAM